MNMRIWLKWRENWLYITSTIYLLWTYLFVPNKNDILEQECADNYCHMNFRYLKMFDGFKAAVTDM